jgi:hypothetical protein
LPQNPSDPHDGFIEIGEQILVSHDSNTIPDAQPTLDMGHPLFSHIRSMQQTVFLIVRLNSEEFLHVTTSIIREGLGKSVVVVKTTRQRVSAVPDDVEHVKMTKKFFKKGDEKVELVM